MHEIRDRLPLRLGATVQPKPLYEDGDPAQHAKDFAEDVDRTVYTALRPEWVDPQLAGTESDLKHPSAPKPEPVPDRSPVTAYVMNDGPAAIALVTFNRTMPHEDGAELVAIVRHQGIHLAKGDRFEFVHCDDEEWVVTAYIRAPLPDPLHARGSINTSTNVSQSPASIEAYRQLMASALEAETRKRGITLPTASALAIERDQYRLRPGGVWFQQAPATIDKSRLPKPRARRADYQQFEPLVVGEDVMLRSGATRLAGYCRAGVLVELTETHGVVRLEGLRTRDDPLGPPTRLERYARSDLESIPF